MRIPLATRSAMLTGDLDVTDGTLTAGLFVGYTFDVGHAFTTDLPDAPVAEVLLDGVSVVDGVLLGTVGTFTAPGTGDPVNALWFYVTSTGRLVGWVDRFGDGTELVIVRDGTDITLPPWPGDRLLSLGSPTG